MAKLASPRPPRKDKSANKLVAVENTRSAELASRGFYTSHATKEFLSSLTADVMHGRVPEKTANTATGIVRTLLRTVEMEQKFGSVDNENEAPNLQLIASEEVATTQSGEVVQ